MKKVSFEEIGALTATFHVQDGVAAGQVVKTADGGTVGPCSANDRFCGVAGAVEDGFAAVQLRGFARVPYTGAVAVGWNKLAADGKGGVTPYVSGWDHLVVEKEILTEAVEAGDSGSAVPESGTAVIWL